MKRFATHIADRVLLSFALAHFDRDKRINESTVVIASNRGVREFLLDHSKEFEHESGFFRLGDTPLDPLVVRQGSALVRRLLLEKQQEQRRSGASYLVQSHLGLKLSTQKFGHLFVAEYFRDALLFSRSSELQRMVDFFIAGSVVRHDVRRRYRTSRWNTDKLNKLFDPLVGKEDARKQPQDLLDVAFACTNSVSDTSEVFRRLILATVGFTGAALEHLLIHYAQYWPSGARSPGYARNFVAESLRMASPAFRISRTAKRSFDTENVHVNSGDQILINLKAAHTESEVWPEPSTFDAQRWSNKEAAKNFLAFGKGSRSCPASGEALICLEDFLSAVSGGELDVSFDKRHFSNSRIGTLISPPRGVVRIFPSA